MEFNLKMNNLPSFNKCKIGVIGMGYVGLPLAIGFSKNKKCLRTGEKLFRSVVGFDINKERILELENFFDKTNEVSLDELKEVDSIVFTYKEKDLDNVDVFLVTVPTPIRKDTSPDLSPLVKASHLIGRVLKNRSTYQKKVSPIIIFESTVYPGATEEVCVPIIETESGLELNNDKAGHGFYCGYSPERINPGDKERRLTNIVKVTSGSNKISALWIDKFYGSIIQAGTHLATSIMVAEAAKVIENTQRDINIALMNELSIIFNKLNINTHEVLEAAKTKWNFLNFKPGLVGGHCIGVDPYYLTYKSQELGYTPQIVLSGRRINDGMAEWISLKLLEIMAKKGLQIKNSKVLIMGCTFKENCPDVRNSKVFELINKLESFGMNCLVFDPIANVEDVKQAYGVKVHSKLDTKQKFDLIVGAVPHRKFEDFEEGEWKLLGNQNSIFADIKGFIPKSISNFSI